MRELYLKFLASCYENDKGKIVPRVRKPERWKNIISVSKKETFLDLNREQLNGRNIWIWSDLHFFHNNVIQYGNRPYKDVEDMHKQLIQNYNDTVQEGDICIFAGDITFKGTEMFNSDILPKFNKSYNILVVGNHDFNKNKMRNLDFDESHLLLELEYKNKKIVISHCPFFIEDMEFINVHGHIHAYKSEQPHQINISVEAIDYKPVLLFDLIENHNLK